MVLFEVKGNSQQIQVKRAALPAVQKEPAKMKAATEVAADAFRSAATSDSAGPTSDAAAEVFGTENGLEVSAQERYRVELQAMLEKKKQYPLLAKRLRQQGKVLVKFTLRRDGSVAAAELIGTSEFETLNNAARELIGQISGLKPFPDEVKKNQWVFVLPVEYRM